VTIRAGSIVEIRYRLFDARGELVETTDEEGPVRYRHGQAEILAGLEEALEGARAGDELRVTLGPEEAYGAHNPEGIVAVPRKELPEGDYAPGAWVAVHFEPDPDEAGPPDEEGDEELEMRVVEVQDDAVIMDANHPLAGQSVTFEVEVVSVEP